MKLTLALTRWGLLVTLTRAAFCSVGVDTHLELAEEPVGHEEMETGDLGHFFPRTLA